MSGRVRIRRPDGTIQVGYRKTQRRNKRRAVDCAQRQSVKRRPLKKPQQLDMFELLKATRSNGNGDFW